MRVDGGLRPQNQRKMSKYFTNFNVNGGISNLRSGWAINMPPVRQESGGWLKLGACATPLVPA